MSKPVFIVFVSLFSLSGLGMLTAAFFTTRSQIDFRKGTISVPGKVVELTPSRGSEGGTLYTPVFEFVDQADRTHRVKGAVASSPPPYETGEAVTVLYRPEDPEKAQLDSFTESWFVPLIFGSMGTVFTSVGGGCIIYSVRARMARQITYSEH